MKRIAFLLICSLMSLSLFAVNDLSLMQKSKEKGITYYWDSLAETGMLEKNGHQITFRKNEQIVILDSVRMAVTDAPEIKNNLVYVSQKFMDDADLLFKENNSIQYSGKRKEEDLISWARKKASISVSYLKFFGKT